MKKKKYILIILAVCCSNLQLLAQHTMDRMAEFPGGETALMEYISTKVKYPELARRSQLEGKVMVNFIIDEKGQHTVVKVKSSGHPMLDTEAVRVINAMPLWKPAIENGKLVRLEFSLPITFSLENDTEEVQYAYLLPSMLAIEKKEYKQANKMLDVLAKKDEFDINVMKLQGKILLEQKKHKVYCEFLQKIFMIGDKNGFTNFTTKDEINKLFAETCSGN